MLYQASTKSLFHFQIALFVEVKSYSLFLIFHGKSQYFIVDGSLFTHFSEVWIAFRSQSGLSFCFSTFFIHFFCFMIIPVILFNFILFAGILNLRNGIWQFVRLLICTGWPETVLHDLNVKVFFLKRIYKINQTEILPVL